MNTRCRDTWWPCVAPRSLWWWRAYKAPRAASPACRRGSRCHLSRQRLGSSAHAVDNGRIAGAFAGHRPAQCRLRRQYSRDDGSGDRALSVGVRPPMEITAVRATPLLRTQRPHNTSAPIGSSGSAASTGVIGRTRRHGDGDDHRQGLPFACAKAIFRHRLQRVAVRRQSGTITVCAPPHPSIHPGGPDLSVLATAVRAAPALDKLHSDSPASGDQAKPAKALDMPQRHAAPSPAPAGYYSVADVRSRRLHLTGIPGHHSDDTATVVSSLPSPAPPAP